MKFLQDKFAFSPKAAIRSIRWLGHPLFGTMYLPAYGIGAEMIQEAVQTYGEGFLGTASRGFEGHLNRSSEKQEEMEIRNGGGVRP